MKAMQVNFKRKVLGLLLAISALTVAMAFTMQDDGMLAWPQNYLMARFDAGAELPKIKKFELQFTPDGFFRFRKTFQNGKQEYFSFNLKRLEDIEYLGSTANGILMLRTARPDIIVQTYNDRTGNIDSMASVVPLPLKSVEPEGLDSLRMILKKIKDL
jgi:hypothetical protein